MQQETNIAELTWDASLSCGAGVESYESRIASAGSYSLDWDALRIGSQTIHGTNSTSRRWVNQNNRRERKNMRKGIPGSPSLQNHLATNISVVTALHEVVLASFGPVQRIFFYRQLDDSICNISKTSILWFQQQEGMTVKCMPTFGHKMCLNHQPHIHCVCTVVGAGALLTWCCLTLCTHSGRRAKAGESHQIVRSAEPAIHAGCPQNSWGDTVAGCLRCRRYLEVQNTDSAVKESDCRSHLKEFDL